MKYLLFILLAFTINAQTWYVDGNATGSNNGTSWTNAWETFADINWASLSSGDTVYVSGGSDSLVYAMNTTIDPDPDVSFSPYVVVCPSWESGKNGKVVITNSTSNQLYILFIRGISGLKMTGFTVRDTRNPANAANGTISFGDISNPGNPVTGRIHVDNFHIISNGTVGNLNFECRDTVIVSNTISEYTTNDLLNEADPLTFTCAENYILIEGCTLIQRNTSTLTDAHRDMMQFNFDSGLGSSIDVVIRNNIAIQTSTEGTSWNAFVYNSTSAIDTTKWYIYNNIFVSVTTGSPMGGVFLYNDSGVSENYWVWNNTFIMNDAGNGLSRPMSAGNNYTTDTIFFQNNLVIEDAPINLFLSAPIFFYKVYYRLFDHNGWFEYGGLSDPFMNGDGFGSFSYTDWQDFPDANTNDVNSITGNSTSVTFANKYGTDITDYYTETGRDLGVDIGSTYSYLLNKFPDLDTDILGNPRTGAWDMGALEYQDGAVDTVPSFSFTGLNNRELNTVYTGSATFSGADSTFHVWTTTGARFNINSSSSLSTTMKTAVNGDVVYVETVTGASYSTGYTETIVAGGVSRDFTVTTKAYVPPSGSRKILKGKTGKISFDKNGRIIYIQ